QPRTYQEKKGFGTTKTKTIKYESPPGVETGIYALRVPLYIWQRIADRNNVSMPENIVVDERTGQALGFWAWVINTPEIPIIITEGAKKAGCLLTLNYVAIALPGIYNGYRQDKNEFGKRIGLPKLIPQLEIFAVEGREIIFCFDNDPKPKTKKNVRTAIVKTGKLFERKGCTVKVISWNKPAKGVDDLITATDDDYFDDLYEERKPLLQFELAELLDLSPYISLKVNQRYLSEKLTPPEEAQLIGLSSGKGTGKSEWLSRQADSNRAKGIKTLVITHRIQLAKALAVRFGIDHIEELTTSETKGVFGYALCIDSVHQNSKAQFDPEDWEGAHIIIDECEQVFWHALNSDTCRRNRVKILGNLEQLLKVAISTGGKIYLSDADLSPIAINYVQNLIEYPVKSWIIKNVYNQNRDKKRKLFVYEGNDPRELITALKKAIANGEKPLIHTSGQKHRSGTGAVNLEKYFRKLFPSLKILRIDSESVADPQHRAYGCVGQLNTILPEYDIVIASPVVETGVSIDIKGHFDSVWCVAWGVQTTDAVCQALERLRDDVPRHLWAKKIGFNKVGNGATKVKQLLASTHKNARANIVLLQRAGILDFDGMDFEWQKAHLEAWAKRAVVVNAGMKKYRESILEKLKVEGYEVVGTNNLDPDPQLKAQLTEEFEQTFEEIAENKKASYGEYRQKVSKADNVNDRELEELREKRSKTEAERLAEHKGNLRQRYQTEVTPELVEKDDNGWYPKLRLYYYLTIGNQFLPNRDKRKIEALTEDTGKAFKPDINRQCIGIKVYTLNLLNIKQFFDENAEFSKYSLADWCDRLRSPKTRAELKTVFGVNICDGDSPIQVAN
ncbi:MAG: plasmid replication protein, CyRepA1 family, partial [Prochloraceae cyanobacterium]